jgi:hypothetical protein
MNNKEKEIMGSVGTNNSGENSYNNTPQSFSYDIDEYAETHGYDSAEDMVQVNLTEDNTFWTRDSDMVDYVEDLGYTVISSPNGEYFVVQDDNDNTDSEFIVYYEKAGSSRYITRVRKG